MTGAASLLRPQFSATPSFDTMIASIRYLHAERESKVSDHSALIVALAITGT